MKIGANKINVTPDISYTLYTLLGWGDPKQKALRVEKPIHVRAIAMEAKDGKRLIFVCIELCFVSESLRRGVMKYLKENHQIHNFQEHEIIITATHNHNAPGGYCHSMLYNFPSKGYYPEVFDRYMKGCVNVILKAWEHREEGQLYFKTGEIPLHEPVAFNRSIRAWNLNPDVTHYRFKDRDQALNRTMDVLLAKNKKGKTLGMISWFAVHCTSIHRDFMAIHSDNKGVASLFVESAFAEEGSIDAVAIFAQGAAGDVSPNFKKYWFKREVRGAFRDDLQSCDFNGKIQADFALKLCKESKPLQSEEINSVITHHDMTAVPIPPEWAQGQTGLHTAPAALGCRFMAGTAEGRATSLLFTWIIQIALQFTYFLKRKRFYTRAHGNKATCVELTSARVFGDANPEDLPIPGFIDPVVQILRFWSQKKVFKGEPMSPYIMPIQLFRIGELGFAALPGEFTTQAGIRLSRMLQPILAKIGVSHLIASGYANSYAGYITTDEEYQLQQYEGACTHFGRYTLLGYMAVFRQLAEKWIQQALSAPVIHELPPPPVKSNSYLRKLHAEFYTSRTNGSLKELN